MEHSWVSEEGAQVIRQIPGTQPDRQRLREGEFPQESTPLGGRCIVLKLLKYVYYYVVDLT